MISFADLMAELGELIGDNLKPDLNQVVALEVNENLRVQIEMDSTGEYVLICCYVCELPPGKFRENILKDALKANFHHDRHPEILAYVTGENALVMFRNVPTQDLKGDEFYEHLALFTERAERWKNAIESGRTSPPDEFDAIEGGHRPPIFGFS